MLDRRRYMGGSNGIPYQQIEYLESSGTQYIDTGILPNNNTKVEIKAKIYKINIGNNGVELFGARNPSNGGYFELLFMATSRVYYQYASQTPVALYSFENVDVFFADKNTLYKNSEIFLSASVSTFSTTRSLYLFALHNNQAERFITADIYYCKIWNDTELVRDFIPVRNGTVGYLYDKVSGELFGNLGTGNFILGPDV